MGENEEREGERGREIKQRKGMQKRREKEKEREVGEKEQRT